MVGLDISLRYIYKPSLAGNGAYISVVCNAGQFRLMFDRKIIPALSILFTLISCDSTRTLYSSADNKNNSWMVNAYTMSHCGCTELYVEKYTNGKNDFQIMYTDNIARKNIYSYNDKGVISDTTALIAGTDKVEIPFDSLDNEIFKKLKTIVDKKDGLVYDIKWTEYKGYNKKD